MSGKILSLTNKDIRSMCLDIANQVQKDNWKPEIVLGITRGGLQAAVYLSYWFDAPMETLKVQLADSKGQHDVDCTESNCWLAEEALGNSESEPKRILIVDDINDSGTTFDWIKKDWEISCPEGCYSRSWKPVWGDSVRFASLASNIYSDFEVNYKSLDVDRSIISWVEFPWSVWWRK